MARRLDAQEVLHRAWILSCVAARGFIEGSERAEERERLRREISAWFAGVSLEKEADPSENGLMATAIGDLPRQRAINGMWRCEGIAVLAWALGLWNLGPFDKQIADPRDMAGIVGYMDDARAKELASKVRLRPADEIESYAEHILNVHWRLRRDGRDEPQYDCRNLFREELESPIPGTAKFELVESDLSIDGKPLATADRDSVRTALSVVMERHRAANWLQGDDEIYSEITLDT